MGFFDNLKDMHKLRSQAAELQKQLAQERITGSSDDGSFLVVINGNQEILEITMPEVLPANPLVSSGIIQAYASAKKKLEDIMKQKMMGSMLG